MIDLRLGDCLELMRDIPDGSVDAVITDPPYGISYSPGGNTSPRLKCPRPYSGQIIIGDNKPFDPRPFLNFPIVVLCGANNYAHLLPASRGWVFWDKKPDIPSNKYGDGELIWTNQDTPIRGFRHRWSGVIRDSENGEKHHHITQKPIALMKWLIECYTQKGNTVLDPFMGSGTTGIACIQTGRNFIGIEINPTYFEIAKRRIEEAQMQLALPMVIA